MCTCIIPTITTFIRARDWSSEVVDVKEVWGLVTVWSRGGEAGRGIRSAMRQIVIRGGKHSLKPERAS